MDANGRRPSSDVHRYLLQTSSVVWVVYRNLLSGEDPGSLPGPSSKLPLSGLQAAGPARMLVPDHTRDAVFQIFSDLRTNSPKDRKWVDKHLHALKPRTLPGWLVGPERMGHACT